MGKPRSLGDKLQKRCDEEFEQFCRKYGRPSEWKELEQTNECSSTFFPKTPQKSISSKIKSPINGKRLNFNPQRKIAKCSAKTKIPSNVKEANSMPSKLKLIPLKENGGKKHSQLARGDPAKENESRKVALSVKRASSESAGKSSLKRRLPLSEKSPVSYMLDSIVSFLCTSKIRPNIGFRCSVFLMNLESFRDNCISGFIPTI